MQFIAYLQLAYIALYTSHPMFACAVRCAEHESEISATKSVDG